jgi:hypothetical protein
MPNLEEHCKNTLKHYGVEGRDIHAWLDEPSKQYAGTHRQFRHDTETIKLVGEVFGKKYGKSIAENIALDHIMLDHEEEIKKRVTIVVQFPPEKESPCIPCSYCNTLLKPGDQFCPKCGASRTKIIEEFDRAYEMEKLKLQEKKKKLGRELKLELALRELTPEERAYLWVDSSTLLEKNWIAGFGTYDEVLQSIVKTPPSYETLSKLGLWTKLGDEVLDRLVKEDFLKSPQLKEQALRKIELIKAKAKEIKQRKSKPAQSGVLHMIKKRFSKNVRGK